MSTEAVSDNPYDKSTPAVTELDRRREALTSKLREARAALSPKAAVAAVARSGDLDEAAALSSSIVAARQAHAESRTRFQPRSMTMKLILERPDVTLRVVLAIATLVFGARLTARFGSAAALVRALKTTLDSVAGPPQAG